MKKKLFVIFTAMMLAVAFMPAVASATWSQEFNESGVGNFDSMKFFMVTPGTDFVVPGIYDFTAAGWTGTLQNSKYITASGPALADMNFKLNFSNTNPFDFYFYAFNGATNVENTIAHWENGWSFKGGAPLPAVPIPAAIWLLGTGLVGLFGVRRRFVI